jgi:hypothetical protein
MRTTGRGSRKAIASWRRLVPIVLAVPLWIGAFISPAAVDGTVTIVVQDRVTGLAVPNGFRYIIDKDIARESPSTTPVGSYSPVAATGDNNSASNVALPNGKYLITVEGGPFPPGGYPTCPSSGHLRQMAT